MRHIWATSCSSFFLPLRWINWKQFAPTPVPSFSLLPPSPPTRLPPSSKESSMVEESILRFVFSKLFRRRVSPLWWIANPGRGILLRLIQNAVTDLVDGNSALRNWLRYSYASILSATNITRFSKEVNASNRMKRPSALSSYPLLPLPRCCRNSVSGSLLCYVFNSMALGLQLNSLSWRPLALGYLEWFYSRIQTNWW